MWLHSLGWTFFWWNKKCRCSRVPPGAAPWGEGTQWSIFSLSKERQSPALGKKKSYICFPRSRMSNTIKWSWTNTASNWLTEDLANGKLSQQQHGVPLHPPPNHLTASSSAIANYSRITLHSFNSAASQALLFQKKNKNCGAPRADGRFSGTAAVELDVSLYCEKKTMQKLAPLSQKTFGSDLQKTV